MAAILRRLPITDAPIKLALPGGTFIDSKNDQIVLWVSGTRPGLGELPKGAPRFPAVLDTGFNSSFLVGQKHLEDWAGLKVRDLTWFDYLVADGQPIPLRDAEVWLHPNRPRTLDPDAQAMPFRLEIATGIAVWPTAIPGSRRLPLLGMRALRSAGLQCHIDGGKGLVTLTSGRSWSWFGWFQ